MENELANLSVLAFIALLYMVIYLVGAFDLWAETEELKDRFHKKRVNNWETEREEAEHEAYVIYVRELFDRTYERLELAA